MERAEAYLPVLAGAARPAFAESAQGWEAWTPTQRQVISRLLRRLAPTVVGWGEHDAEGDIGCRSPSLSMLMR